MTYSVHQCATPISNCLSVLNNQQFYNHNQLTQKYFITQPMTKLHYSLALEHGTVIHKEIQPEMIDQQP